MSDTAQSQVTARCNECPAQAVPVEWLRRAYSSGWAYFYTLHGRPDSGAACEASNGEVPPGRSVVNDGT